MKTLPKILYKLLILAVLIVALNLLYRYTFYPADVKAHCELMEMSQKAKQEKASILYLAESSNRTFSWEDTDRRMISDFIDEALPGQKVCNLSHDACHAGIYYDILRNIPKDNDIHSVIVTMNLRSFSVEWIYSDLETPLNKQQVMMKPGPALLKRTHLAFKGYHHWSDEKRKKLIQQGFKKSTFQFPYDFPYANTSEWDRAVALRQYPKETAQIADSVIALACHYVKCYAYELNDRNPRIKDFDRIVRLCEKRGWTLYFNILAENVDQMDTLLGPDLVLLLEKNVAYLKQRYDGHGATVIDNSHNVRDADFIERDFPSEHYREAGRKAIARNVVAAFAKK